MSTEFVQSSVYLTKNQREFLRDNYVNLSRLTRAGVNSLMKKSEGHVSKDEPTDKTILGDLTNG